MVCLGIPGESRHTGQLSVIDVTVETESVDVLISCCALLSGTIKLGGGRMFCHDSSLGSSSTLPAASWIARNSRNNQN